MKKALRKGDFFLFFFFLAAALLIAAAPLVRPSQAAKYVRITVEGAEYGIYPLNEDAEIEIDCNGHFNAVTIQGGIVRMNHSSCHNQICVNTGNISRTGETIVCLPNRVVVEIIGNSKGGEDDEAIDAVVK